MISSPQLGGDDKAEPNKKRMRMRAFVLFCASFSAMVGPADLARAAQSSPAMRSAAVPGSASKVDGRQAKWLTHFGNATSLARKDDKLILAYFRGSDWCPFCQKLDKEVLNTKPFIEWAEKNVILLDVDFPADKRQPPGLKKQNDALKERYGVIKTPTFVFLDADGEPIARCGFDTAKLRDDEPRGQPKAFVEYLRQVVRTRPKKQGLIEQQGFAAGQQYAREHALPLLVLLTARPGSEAGSGREAEEVQKTIRALTANQKFVRFVNAHMAFTRVTWPADDDYSIEALEFLRWAHRKKVPVLPFQLVVWDPRTDQVTARVPVVDTVHIEPTLNRLRDLLPRIDYTGKWIEDYRLAMAISAQTGRDVLMNFTSSDSSEWSRRLDREVYQQEFFKEYARKNLVLLRLDFPRAEAARAKQPEKIAEQNRLLAESHGVRGYPTVIFLNPRGQKFGEAKYMRGGPEPFLQALDQLRKADYERRTILSDQFRPEDVR